MNLKKDKESVYVGVSVCILLKPSFSSSPSPSKANRRPLCQINFIDSHFYLASTLQINFPYKTLHRY